MIEHHKLKDAIWLDNEYKYQSSVIFYQRWYNKSKWEVNPNSFLITSQEFLIIA